MSAGPLVMAPETPPARCPTSGPRTGRRLAMGLIRIYQRTVSPWLGPHCRFDPSCSQYAVEAIGRHGVVRGAGHAVRRLGRCHPWGGAGYDPVP